MQLRGLLAAVVLWISLAAPVLASTTTFQSAGCNSGITISNGGLTLTHDATTTWEYCQANVGKWGATYITSNNSLLYYEFTPGHAATALSVGVSAASSLPGATPISGSINFLGGEPDAAGYLVGSGQVWSRGWELTGLSAGANGVKGAIVVNMKTDPWQFWATNNIANLVCDGAGNSGSTHPIWNGSCASDPSLSGTGFPQTPNVVGFGINLPGYEAWPAVTLGQNDAVTFNFADDSTLDALLPSGYQAWNNNQGETPPTILPTGTVTINIANAPGWTASHTYTASSSGIPRVLAGAGWNGTAFVSGQPLCLFALKAGSGASSGTDPTVFNTACASGTPANVGGAVKTATPPSGWNSATTVTDGSLTWVLLAQGQGSTSTVGPLLYPTITSANGDSAVSWATGASFGFGDFAINGGKIYQQLGSTTPTCTTSGSPGGPTGTTVGTGITDNTCAWFYRGALVYSPQAYLWPHVVHPGTDGHNEMTYGYNIKLVLWWGGPTTTAYVNGSGNEVAAIAFDNHLGYTSEATPLCPGGGGGNIPLTAVPIDSNAWSCLGLMASHTITLVQPPGDSFKDVLTAGPLGEANGANGVLLSSSQAFSASVGSGAGLILEDGGFKMSGMQISSANGPAIIGCCGNQAPSVGFSPFLDGLIANQNIFQCGGSLATYCVSSDANNQFTNNFFIDNMTLAGSITLWNKYPNVVANNTFITAPGTTNKTAINMNNNAAGVFKDGGPFFPPPVSNNYYFGYANCWAYSSAWSSTASIVTNGGDVSSCPSGTFVDSYSGSTLIEATLGGSVGLTASTELVNPTIGASLDARIKSTGASGYGAGTNFNFVLTTGSFWGAAVTPGNDIFGNARSGRVDIGAAQFQASLPAVGGGRRFLH